MGRTTNNAILWKRLLDHLRRSGGALVAFSGGVDSTLLLAAAAAALGERVLAVTAVSPTLPAQERRQAARLARRLGVRHREVEGGEWSQRRFLRNQTDRCYVCKKIRLRQLIELAAEEGLGPVLEGSHAEDRPEDRPGSRAIRELGVRSPLQELGLSKAQVRRLARWRGLPNWNQPASACLATRIPFGEALEAERLRRIKHAEEFLRGLGFGQVRVRDHQGLARIETAGKEFGKLLDSCRRRRIERKLRQLGFRFVSVDLAGYRSGSLRAASDSVLD